MTTFRGAQNSPLCRYFARKDDDRFCYLDQFFLDTVQFPRSRSLPLKQTIGI